MGTGTTGKLLGALAGAAALAVPAPAVAAPSPLDPLVAQAVAGVVAANVPGVAQATASTGSASASAIDLPGVATIGKASTTKDSAKVVVLGVGGRDLVTKEGDAAGGHYTGPAAGVGRGVDQFNDGMCPADGAARTTCIRVLESMAMSTATPDGKVKSNSALFHLARVQAGDMDGATVLPVTAMTTSSYGRCIDLSTAFIAGGTGTFALTRIVGPKFKLGSFLAPC